VQNSSIATVSTPQSSHRRTTEVQFQMLFFRTRQMISLVWVTVLAGALGSFFSVLAAAELGGLWGWV
jgi:hypothetical protein